MFQIEKTSDSFGRPCVRVSARGLNTVILLVKTEAQQAADNYAGGRSYSVVQCATGEKVRGRLVWSAGPMDGIDKEDIVALALREVGLDPSAGWEDITAVAC